MLLRSAFLTAGFWLSFALCGLGTDRSAAAAPAVSAVPQANGTAEIEAAGTAGNAVEIEALSDLAARNWELISSLRLASNRVRWTDPWCGTSPTRFYRITERKAGGLPPAANFRLNDHLGRSHELHYYWNTADAKAIVLIFTAVGCAEVQHQLPAIQALRDKYEARGVKFWMIDSNPADSRAKLAAEAVRLGINIPILQDGAQSVAHLYGATRAAEVVCVESLRFGVFYRGALDERTTAAEGQAARRFADEALEEFLAGKPVTVRRTKPAGCDVPVISAGAVADTAYSARIAPLLQAKCVSCHSPGNIAPWAMTNHASVQAYAELSLREIAGKNMPPWHADPEHGRFKDNMALTVEQERMLVQWLAAGAPRGSGPDPLENVPPPPPKWPVELGEPDLVLRAPSQQIMANGVEPYRYVFVPTGLTEDKWLRAAVVRPGNPKVVHHYLVWEGESTFQMAAGLAGYVPGMQPRAFPDGTGVLLSAGATLTFNLHYTPDGEEATDEPELGLWFHETPPAKSLFTLPLLSQGFRIPPGVRDHQLTVQLPVPTPYPITIYSMSPHMHLRGSRMKFEMIDPSGKRETLLSVPKYDFDWQTGYTLEQPRVIPKGSRIIVTGAFDNSPQNPFNPDPTETVRWGDQSYEEMFIGYFTFTEEE